MLRMPYRCSRPTSTGYPTEQWGHIKGQQNIISMNVSPLPPPPIPIITNPICSMNFKSQKAVKLPVFLTFMRSPLMCSFSDIGPGIQESFLAYAQKRILDQVSGSHEWVWNLFLIIHSWSVQRFGERDRLCKWFSEGLWAHRAGNWERKWS